MRLLTEADKAEIIRRYDSELDKPRYGRRWTQPALAVQYGVGQSTIQRIVDSVSARPSCWESCSVTGCGKTGTLTRGMCEMHYTRWQRHGDPQFVLGKGVPRTDSPGYFAKHNRVKKARGRASQFLCAGCCGGRAEDWATVHGTEGLDVWHDYVALCTRCYLQYDGFSHGRWEQRDDRAAGRGSR